jgi:hypothetical protein
MSDFDRAAFSAPVPMYLLLQSVAPMAFFWKPWELYLKRHIEMSPERGPGDMSVRDEYLLRAAQEAGAEANALKKKFESRAGSCLRLADQAERNDNPVSPSKRRRQNIAIKHSCTNGSILKAANPHEFSAETVRTMQVALDLAWGSLTPEQRAQSSKTLLATRILDAAEAGERSPARLLMLALRPAL